MNVKLQHNDHFVKVSIKILKTRYLSMMLKSTISKKLSIITGWGPVHCWRMSTTADYSIGK